MRSERCTLVETRHPANAARPPQRTREEHVSARPIRYLAAIALWTLPNLAGAQSPSTPAPEVLRVTRTADDGGEGSLRWAIERNNAAPGRLRIEVDPAGAAPYVIKLASPLPTIKGPVAIEGAPWKRSGEFVALDGSGYIEDKGPQTCPGAVAGQYGANVRTTTNPGLALVDTQGVEISGLEIRNFCIGVLIHRASGNSIHDNRIVGNRGGAGVNLVADNVFRSTGANPEPSQGIEILLGNDNVVVSNRFEGYSDGLQINWGHRNYIAANIFSNNTFGLSLSGAGNVIDGNVISGNAVGIAVRPAADMTMAWISRNAIYGNGQKIERCFAGGSCDPNIRKGGIVFGLPSGEHERYVGKRGAGVAPPAGSLAKICPDGAPNCQAPPNGGLAAPTLERVRKHAGELIVQGELRGKPRSRFTVEVFGNRAAGSGEGEMFLGEVATTSDAEGQGKFSLTVDAAKLAAMPASFTATLTSADGATSEFSQPVALSE